MIVVLSTTLLYFNELLFEKHSLVTCGLSWKLDVEESLRVREVCVTLLAMDEKLSHEGVEMTFLSFKFFASSSRCFGRCMNSFCYCIESFLVLRESGAGTSGDQRLSKSTLSKNGWERRSSIYLLPRRSLGFFTNKDLMRSFASCGISS